ADVAHELRTPLTSIQGYARALQDGVVDSGPETERVLNTIGRESERMGGLIAQLLDLSRLESGQTQIAFDRVDIESLIERATERFRGVAQNKGLLLSSAAPDALAV